MFRVDEVFVNFAALEAHAARMRNGVWQEATAGIRRDDAPPRQA